MPRVKIRKKGTDLWSVYVVPSRPGEKRAEPATTVTAQDLEKTIADKIARMQSGPTETAGQG